MLMINIDEYNRLSIVYQYKKNGGHTRHIDGPLFTGPSASAVYFWNVYFWN